MLYFCPEAEFRVAMQVEAEYDPGTCKEQLADSRGALLPPFIVLEKGESLSDWTDRAKPDIFQGIAVRCCISFVCCAHACCHSQNIPVLSDTEGEEWLQVLVHVAKRLRDMHAAGYVHRDVKPGNIMLLPRKNWWTVIDFGCTARTGELAPLSFTLQYCPPEVLRAWLMREKEVVAAEAMDAWAMGVVAFELLTGHDAFSFGTGRAQVR